MSRKIYFLCLVHNTTESPYRLAKEIARSAATEFEAVRHFSFCEPVHSTLLPLVGQQPGTFDHNTLALQMPWEHEATPPVNENGLPVRETATQLRERKNRTKYATAFIEGIEAMRIGVNQNVFGYWFMRELQRQLLDVAADARVLFIITDLRAEQDVRLLKEKCSASGCLVARVLCPNNTRLDIRCPELDSSNYEGFAKNIKPDVLNCEIDPTTETCIEWTMQKLRDMRGSLV